MPLDIRHAWYRTIGLIALALLAALAVGLLSGQLWPVLALSAIAILVRQFWKLHRVLERLGARMSPNPPEGDGIWDALDRLIYRSQSETRSSKRRLLEMLRAYRAAAAALPDAIVVVERSSQRIQWVNEAAGRLLGLQYPRDIGATLGDRLDSPPIAQWLAADSHAEPLQDVASPLGADIRLLLRLIPYSNEMWLLVARDISKIMRLEHMRRDFVANVSHELRTPLTVVHGYLDMLDPADQPEWAPILTEMQRQSQRMTQLVEDLLTLSRLEAQERLPEEAVGMAGMLATLLREAKVLSQQRHTIVARDEAGVDLWGSIKELHSAFSNLVSNAIRYTPAGGTIRIRFAPDEDGGVMLSVQDTGYGIPSQHLPRITERFYRVSTSRSRESGGTGLGLSIVKHVLHLHQARLEIESEVGRGSVFSCRFGRERVHPRDHGDADDHHLADAARFTAHSASSA
jgi:two-component system, OmpR family, phosphate regulon sensor histidine kinase PhoR